MDGLLCCYGQEIWEEEDGSIALFLEVAGRILAQIAIIVGLPESLLFNLVPGKYS
jgi:hypothetical protein